MFTGYGLEWHPSVSLVPLFLAGLAAVGLAVYAWRHRETRTAYPFVGLMVGLFVWAVGYGIELGFTGQAPMLAMDKVAFVGSVITPTAWLLLAVEYAGYEEYLSPRVFAALVLEPIAVLFLVWTNELHGLIWKDVGVHVAGEFTVLDLTFGPAYWLNFAYSYLLILAGIVLIASVVPRATRIYRWQSLFLVVGVVVPLGANALFHLPGLNPVPNLDLTTFAFAVTSVAYALALFRFRMLDLVPAARDQLIDRMDDGTVVIDDDGAILDVNPAAGAALGVEGDLPSVDSTPLGDGDGVHEGLLTLDVDGAEHTYDVTTRPITDFRGDEVGRFAVLHDITQLEVLQTQEQRLSVLNRLLRHNIRNEMNVISGRVDLLADEVDADARSHLAPIDRAVERVLNLSRHARHIESTITEGVQTAARVDLAPVCAAVLDDVAEGHPEASIERTLVDTAWAEGLGHDQAVALITALVENAVVHNPSRSPRVAVTLEAGDGTVRLTVADDGPGIPEGERAILQRDRETPLDHGSGLGLWLVTWSVDAAGGSVDFAESDLGGTAVTVELPAVDPAALGTSDDG